MTRIRQFAVLGTAVLGMAAFQAQAKVSEAEAAKLGKELTPIGAEKKASADGSIPEWTGGMAPHGNLKSQWSDFDADLQKFSSEKPMYTITKANMATYKDKLAVGHQKMLERHPTYKMHVYKSQRNGAYPQAIYDATIKNATTAELAGGDPDALKGAKLGFPFPIPQSGAELVWNHRLTWRGEAVRRFNNQIIVQPNGTQLFTKLIEEVLFPYASIKNPGSFEAPDSVSIFYLSETVAPPRNAGQFILAWEHPGARSAWIYSPALRRIRRAPTVAYDNPYEGTDGNQFYDQVDMINGKLDRFTWKLIGKKEMIIPYNSAKINDHKLKYKDICKPGHVDQDLARYELHRVWIVEANNKPEVRHTFKKKVLYFDEDSYVPSLIDNYDQRDQYYKFQEGHTIYAPNVQTVGTVPELIYDLQTGGYFATALINEDVPNDFSVSFDKEYFTPDAVKKRTTR
jgi:hypothetical protein